MFEVPLYIGGRAQSALATCNRINPLSGEPATSAEAATAAFPAGSTTTPNARRALLLKATLQHRPRHYPIWDGGTSPCH